MDASRLRLKLLALDVAQLYTSLPEVLNWRACMSTPCIFQISEITYSFEIFMYVKCGR